MNIKITVLIIMTVAALINVSIKFWGDWWIFTGILFWQLLATKEIGAYLFDRKMSFSFGPGLARDSSNFSRKLACGFYLISYVFFFFKT